MRGLGAGLFLFCACLKTPCGLDIMFTEKMTRERNEAIKKKPCCVFTSNGKRNGRKRAPGRRQSANGGWRNGNGNGRGSGEGDSGSGVALKEGKPLNC